MKRTIIFFCIAQLILWLLSGCGKSASFGSFQSTPNSDYSFALKYSIQKNSDGSAAVDCSLTGGTVTPIQDHSDWSDSSENYACVLASTGASASDGQYWTIGQKPDGSVFAVDGKSHTITLNQQ